MILALLLACRTATVVDACAADPARCLACERDADCAFGGNPCTDTVYCAHRDAEIAVIEIGCDAAIEYAWPDDAACTCAGEVAGVGAVCAYTP